MTPPESLPIDPAGQVIDRVADHVELTWGASLLSRDAGSLEFTRGGKTWRVTVEEVTDPQ